jgi:hypothetical protein
MLRAVPLLIGRRRECSVRLGDAATPPRRPRGVRVDTPVDGPHYRVVVRSSSWVGWPRLLLWLLGLAFLAAACGSDGGSGSSTNAPIISNMRVSYTPGNPSPGVQTQVTFLVDVADADGDWVGGQCEFVTGDQLVVPIQTTGLPANATTGTALCPFIEVFQNNARLIDLRIVDRAGHPSNVLEGQANLQGRRAQP